MARCILCNYVGIAWHYPLAPSILESTYRCLIGCRQATNHARDCIFRQSKRSRILLSFCFYCAGIFTFLFTRSTLGYSLSFTGILSSAHCLSTEAGCASNPDSLSQLLPVYPKTTAATLSLCVSSDQTLLDGAGWGSLPDKLSHDTWVYPSTSAATCSLVRPLPENILTGTKVQQISMSHFSS